MNLLSSAYAVEMSMDQSRRIEENIGKQISAMRKIRKYTQKRFAEVLTAHGLPVDASAVSRMEKGERALKISECIMVAEALEVDLPFLLRGVQTAAQELKETRNFANLSMRSASEDIWNWLSNVLDVKWTIERDSELMHQIDEGLKSADEYLPLVTKWVSRLKWKYEPDDVADAYILVRDNHEKKQLLQYVNAYFEARIEVDVRLSNDHS